MVCVDGENVRLAVLEIRNDWLAVRLHAVHLMLGLMYPLLVLLKGLISLEELRNIGLVGYFEHGDSLDGHLVGGNVELAIDGFWKCKGRFLEIFDRTRGNARGERNIWRILILTLEHETNSSQSLVSTVGASGMVMDPSVLRYRPQSFGLGPLHLSPIA